MGSWNATCGITQLPIRAGTPVVLIPLVVKQQDFLARDNLAGAGSTSNDLIAQPLTLPLFGVYNDYGGIEADTDSHGYRYLVSLLTKLAEDGKLLHNANGSPKALKKVMASTMDKFQAGELLVKVANDRKSWLVGLKKTIDAQEDKRGFAHYEAQLRVDPATLPDHHEFALGYMLVPHALFDELCRVQGSHAAHGYFDEAKRKMVEFAGTRAEELAAMCNVNAPQRTTLLQFFKDLTKDLGPDTESGLNAGALTTGMLMHAKKQAVELNSRHFYYGDAAEEAVRDSAMNDDAVARALWVSFHLFAETMVRLRKQWTPQCGAGDSNGLEESADLYAVTSAFMAQALNNFKAEELADAAN